MDVKLKLAALLPVLSLTLPVWASPEAAYQAAIKDASVATQDEISRELVAILPDSPNVVWNADRTAVLMLTWTGWTGYDDAVNSQMTLQREVWATPVPTLQKFCQNPGKLPAEGGLTLRLEQLMGLPPGNGKTRFVEMWVTPDNLFRPSPDPAITDHEAELDFPVSAAMSVTQGHKEWINNLKASSYGKDGYPWTRLGYTYDWGRTDSHVGLSEFVIQQNSDVTIKSVQQIDSYCAASN